MLSTGDGVAGVLCRKDGSTCPGLSEYEGVKFDHNVKFSGRKTSGSLLSAVLRTRSKPQIDRQSSQPTATCCDAVHEADRSYLWRCTLHQTDTATKTRNDLCLQNFNTPMSKPSKTI